MTSQLFFCLLYESDGVLLDRQNEAVTFLLQLPFSTSSASCDFKPKASSSSGKTDNTQPFASNRPQRERGTVGRRPPVRMRSIFSTTRSASSVVKHMGGLNFSTLRWGPSALRRTYCSFSLGSTHLNRASLSKGSASSYSAQQSVGT